VRELPGVAEAPREVRYRRGMENPEYWDRLTATLAQVDLRDLEAVWGFLSHAGVIEHDRRGAFDQVVTAVTGELARGEITGPSYARRIASHLQGFQSPRGAQPDPGGAEARVAYGVWSATRNARRAGLVPYPGARSVESGSVAGDVHITWSSYLVPAPLETVLARYEATHGPARPDHGKLRAFHFAVGSHRLTLCPATERAGFPGGTGAALADEQTFLLISSQA
jgi:hypothetical protein